MSQILVGGVVDGLGVQHFLSLFQLRNSSVVHFHRKTAICQ